MKTVRILIATIAFAVFLSCAAGYRITEPEFEDSESEYDESYEDDLQDVFSNFEIDIEAREENSDVGLRVPELVTKYGYPLESHTMETPDGYVLTMHRIPHGKNNAGRKAKKVIYLQHGLLCSSADWVLMGPEKGIGYLLADRGYDVWMGNARGNTYSRKNVKWDPDNDAREFWDFSWHEIGAIDLPTMIDYILNKTEVEKIFYLGHSQGTTAFWVLGSERPEYMEKITMMTALAPICYMGNLPNKAFKFIAQFQDILAWVIDYIGEFEFLPSDAFMHLLDQTLCKEQSVFHEICSNILFLVAGYDSAQLNRTTVPVILSNTPAGSSTKQFLHYGQLYKSNEFQKYDYGSERNKEIYGPEYAHPPQYDLSKITVPVALFYGDKDALAGVQDVLRLYETLPHVVRLSENKYKEFTHLDFLWANDVVKLLYNEVLDLISRY